MVKKVCLLNGKFDIRQGCFVALRHPTLESPPSLLHSFRPLVFLIALGCALTLLAGCATVDPQPFSEFSLAVQELRDGADGALSVSNESNRERYIEHVAKQSQTSAGRDDVLNLFVESVKADPFGWQMRKIPLFMMSKRFQAGVYALNSSLVAYAELLKNLAAPEAVSKETFDNLARDLDAGLSAAAGQLEVKEADQELAMMSAAARQAAYSYLNNKRSKSLEKIVEANQVNIAAIAGRLQEALRLSAENLRTAYRAEGMALAKKLTPGADDSPGSRGKTVKQFVELNEEYVGRLETLRALNRSLDTLPNAHRELAQAIKRPQMKLSSIRDLAKQGKALNKLYRELKSN